MIRIYAKHEPDPDGDRLAKVIDEMRLTGAPTIRAVRRRDDYFAIEGSHRLAAAEHLGLEPKLLIMKTDLDDGRKPFWDRVAPNPPPYDFLKVEALDTNLHLFKSTIIYEEPKMADAVIETTPPTSRENMIALRQFALTEASRAYGSTMNPDAAARVVKIAEVFLGFLTK